MPIRSIMDIPDSKTRKRLYETDPTEGERVYNESMRVLNTGTTVLSVVAIVISILCLLLSAISG